MEDTSEERNTHIDAEMDEPVDHSEDYAVDSQGNSGESSDDEEDELFNTIIFPTEEEDEDYEDEETEGINEAESDSDGAQTFDISLPTIHSYLGDIDSLPRAESEVYFSHGDKLELLLISLANITLFPGETLPLRLVHAVDIAAIHQIASNNSRIFGVINSKKDTKTGTIAEIKYMKRASEG